MYGKQYENLYTACKVVKGYYIAFGFYTQHLYKSGVFFQDSINGHLFLIKHLLILREQIAPFDVDFAVKEMSLDFSKMRTAAYGLWSHSNRLFALSGNNALLEFLLDVSLLDIKERDALISGLYALVLMCL